MSAMMPPANSKERCVDSWLEGVVPISWRRAVRRRVSLLKDHDGKCCVCIAEAAVGERCQWLFGMWAAGMFDSSGRWRKRMDGMGWDERHSPK